MGAGRLSAATAPVSPLVDRLTRCTDHPALRSASSPCASIQARTSGFLEQRMSVSWAGSRSVESTKATCASAASIWA
ncbi:hypothetical protein [Geodermatophilus sp. URMC 65]